MITYKEIKDRYMAEYPPGAFKTTKNAVNIFGIRSHNTKPNAFDDIIGIAYIDSYGFEKCRTYKATTDPGLYYLLHPMNVNGTAILDLGFHKDIWNIGFHKGKRALVQVRPCTVIRDRNQDAVLDFLSENKQTGMYGINLHGANIGRETKIVDKWSAGCQVMADERELKQMLSICDNQVACCGILPFSYALFMDVEDQKKEA